MADVSVVIPTRNRASKLRQSVDSALSQSDPVREVIVVDDGSADGTAQCLRAYGDRVRPFFLAHAGVSAARNHGIRAAQGRWIAFLDDDDVWIESKIERQMAVAAQNPRARLLHCSVYAVDEDLRILYERPASPAHRGDVFEQLLARNFICTSCVLARRDAIEEAGYMDTGLASAQDWDLWLRIAARHPADFATEPLVLYRKSVSGSVTSDIARPERLRLAQIVQDRALRLRHISPRARRRARYEMQRSWAFCWLAQGDRRKALPHVLRALALRPASPATYRMLLRLGLPRMAQDLPGFRA